MKIYSTNVVESSNVFRMRLREARKKKFSTQAKMAEAIGFDTETISRWERGEREPKISDLSLIAEKLDQTVAYFFLKPGQSVVEDDEMTDREAIRLIRRGLEFLENQAEEQHTDEPVRTNPSYRVRNQAFETARELRGKKAEEKSG
ncbi:MAG TPA: XRE family transcriptional regulator [Phycisphaerales bacterium]|nr:XRE family transcriptional regulator [Phycisphaerales bacterium]